MRQLFGNEMWTLEVHILMREPWQCWVIFCGSGAKCTWSNDHFLTILYHWTWPWQLLALMVWLVASVTNCTLCWCWHIMHQPSNPPAIPSDVCIVVLHRSCYFKICSKVASDQPVVSTLYWTSKFVEALMWLVQHCIAVLHVCVLNMAVEGCKWQQNFH